MNIFLDIETIPGQKPGLRELLAADITVPGSYKKAESIAEWEAQQKPQLVEEAWRKTALDGAHGQVACASIAIDDGSPICFWEEDWATAEPKILHNLFSTIEQAYDPSSMTRPVFIGHNIAGFDLRFLYHRAVINGVRPATAIPFGANAWDSQVFDTMFEWAGRNKYVSLTKLCEALGIDGKGDIDGSKVWDYVRAGRISEVASYCDGDVLRVREAHRRLTFQEAA